METYFFFKYGLEYERRIQNNEKKNFVDFLMFECKSETYLNEYGSRGTLYIEREVVNRCQNYKCHSSNTPGSLICSYFLVLDV